MFYVGVDGALTKTGLVALYDMDEEPFDECIIKTNAKHSMVDRLHEIRVQYHRFIRSLRDYRDEPIMVAIEESFVGTNIKTYGKLQQVRAVLSLASFDHDADMVGVTPQKLKQFCCGTSANLQKIDVREAVYRRWNYERTSSDLIDAFALAQVARAIILGVGGAYKRWQVDCVSELAEAVANGRA